MPIRLIPIESGYMSADTGIMCEGASGRSRFPVACWVIEHPKGLVIFDTGLHEDLQKPSERLTAVSQYFDVEIPEGHTLSRLLEMSDIDITQIKYMVLSHLHFDHCGGTAEIENAQIIIQAAEWRAAHDAAFIDAGVYDPADYDLGHVVRQIEGEYDLFGDGTVICLPTPGHTAGHQSLRIELDSGPVILTADCAYWQSMLDGMLVPPHGFDTKMQKDSMLKLKALQGSGCRLLLGHDTAQWQAVAGKILT